LVIQYLALSVVGEWRSNVRVVADPRLGEREGPHRRGVVDAAQHGPPVLLRPELQHGPPEQVVLDRRLGRHRRVDQRGDLVRREDAARVDRKVADADEPGAAELGEALEGELAVVAEVDVVARDVEVVGGEEGLHAVAQLGVVVLEQRVQPGDVWARRQRALRLAPRAARGGLGGGDEVKVARHDLEAAAALLVLSGGVHVFRCLFWRGGGRWWLFAGPGGRR